MIANKYSALSFPVLGCKKFLQVFFTFDLESYPNDWTTDMVERASDDVVDI